MSDNDKNMEIKIIFLNMFCLPLGLDSSNSIGDGKDRLELFFYNYGKYADILILCEVWESVLCKNSESYLKSAISLSKKYNFNYHSFKSREWYEVCNNGLIIFSKYPIKYGSSITYGSSSGSQWFIPKGVLFSEIMIHKSIDTIIPIMFFVTHLHSGPPDNSFMNSDEKAKNVQKNQLIELKKFMEKYKSLTPNKKWICIGDFNIDSRNKNSRDYKFMTDILGYESCLAKVGSPSTYPSYPNNCENECIDHCFTNINNIKTEAKFLKSGNFHLSDHAAIYISINV